MRRISRIPTRILDHLKTDSNFVFSPLVYAAQLLGEGSHVREGVIDLVSPGVDLFKEDIPVRFQGLEALFDLCVVEQNAAF